jgi:hypothetical protein
VHLRKALSTFNKNQLLLLRTSESLQDQDMAGSFSYEKLLSTEEGSVDYENSNPPRNLQQKPCSDPTVQPAQPRARAARLMSISGIFPCRVPRPPAGRILPRLTQGNSVGNNCFPLVSGQAVLHAPPPFQRQQQPGPHAPAGHQID